MTKPRKKASEARAEILDVAQTYLSSGGPDAVKVQQIAADLGVTDAAVHYHFKNRDNLLMALLKHAGRELKRSLTENLHSQSTADIARELDRVYRGEGMANLAMWLSFAGAQNQEKGMFRELVNQQKTNAKTLKETQFRIAMLNLVLAAEPLLGEGFLRSVDLEGSDKNRREFREWMIKKLTQILD